MTRVASNVFFEGMVRNIQDSFKELTKLQTQLQTMQTMERPSDDPVTANQAIILERNLREVQQYQENVDTGYDFLTYSDQILSTLQAPINQAIEKAQQGLNAEMDDTARSAISNEVQSVLNTIISIGNSTLGDKSIFGGYNYIGEPFQMLGNDVLFTGDNQEFSVNIFGTEYLQANITAEQAFGARANILDSERDLDPFLPPLDLDLGVRIDEDNTVNTTRLHVTGRIAALNAFEKAGYAKASGEYGLLSTALGTYDAANFTDIGTYKDFVRDEASIALGATAGTITYDLTSVVLDTVQAAESEYRDTSNQIVLKEGSDLDAATLAVTLDENKSGSVSKVIDAINAAVYQAAGAANANVEINARNATIRAFNDAGASAADSTAFATAIDTITVDATTTSISYREDVLTEALGVFAAADYNSLTADEQTQTDRALEAARNTFSEVEFSASLTRSGLSVFHTTGTRVSLDTGASTQAVVNDLEMGSENNEVLYTNIQDATQLTADRILTFYTSTNEFLNVNLFEGDTATEIAKRVNRAVNESGVPEELRQIVASTDSSTGTEKLKFNSKSFFTADFNDATETDYAN
ncbi:MAG: hypothetical protein HQL32_10845, partial [Planctomycetes bacterium]|nr:hypothetical protein [Planctomycetota bacterium]